MHGIAPANTAIFILCLKTSTEGYRQTRNSYETTYIFESALPYVRYEIRFGTRLESQSLKGKGKGNGKGKGKGKGKKKFAIVLTTP